MSDKKSKKAAPKKKPESEEEESEEEEEETSEEEEGGEEETTSEEEEAGSDGEKPSKEEKKLVSSKSHVAGGKAKSEVKKTWFGSSDQLLIEVSIPSISVKPGGSVDIHVNIKNQSSKTVKSIQAWLRVFAGLPKGKGKKAKRPKPKKMDNTEQEYFQGARFPLQGWVDYDGDVSFPIPDSLSKSKEDTAYELVLNFDVAGAIGSAHVQAFLPITIA